MTNEELTYNDITLSLDGAVKSQMFGKPCLKTGGKAFACYLENEMVFKLSGENHKNALSLNGSKLFDPSGKNRPMKEWVQVPAAHRDKWAGFAQSAKEYISQGNQKEKK